MSDEGGPALLGELIEFTCRPPRVVCHRWQVGDLVVWDNRGVLHRACGWDMCETRVMRHTRIAGDRARESRG